MTVGAITATDRTFVIDTHRIDGIAYKVIKTYDADGLVGSILDTPCACMGHRIRMHSVDLCPWQQKRLARIRDGG